MEGESSDVEGDWGKELITLGSQPGIKLPLLNLKVVKPVAQSVYVQIEVLQPHTQDKVRTSK